MKIYAICSECLQEKPLTEKEGKILCRECAINNKTNEMIEKLFRKEEIKR